MSDNISEADDMVKFIVVISPRYTYYVLIDEFEFTPNIAGRYAVRYYVEDEDGNYAVRESVLIAE